MKKIFSILTLLIGSIPVFSQNGTCTLGTLSINLKTADSINHLVNTPYTPVNPKVVSTIYDSSKVSLTLWSNVNVNTLGVYFDRYTAIDKDGLVLVCSRFVFVRDTSKVPSKIINYYHLRVLVYPNPLHSNRFTIDLINSNTSENINLIVYDIQGREVLNSFYESSSKLLNVSLENCLITKGTYVIKVKQGDKSFNKLLMIQ